MRIFDLGFYDGKDTAYYLERGHEVTAFEANPEHYNAGLKKFAAEIDSGRLQLLNLGIGTQPGEQVDFFVNNEHDEFGTFRWQAPIRWGSGNFRSFKVPCITPLEMFARFGCPDYLKCDIEGFDIFVAEALMAVSEKPSLVSFEGSDVPLLRSLLLAGYRSFKMVDQQRVPLQVVHDAQTGRTFQFSGGAGPYGDDAEGEWLSYEAISYMYMRFVFSPFGDSRPPDSWFDIHASLREPALDAARQREYIQHTVIDRYSGHCGLRASQLNPTCPAAGLPQLETQLNERSAELERVRTDLTGQVQILRTQLTNMESSRAWKAALLLRRLASPLKRFYAPGSS